MCARLNGYLGLFRERERRRKKKQLLVVSGRHGPLIQVNVSLMTMRFFSHYKHEKIFTASTIDSWGFLSGNHQNIPLLAHSSHARLCRRAFFVIPSFRTKGVIIIKRTVAVLISVTWRLLKTAATAKPRWSHWKFLVKWIIRTRNDSMKIYLKWVFMDSGRG